MSELVESGLDFLDRGLSRGRACHMGQDNGARCDEGGQCGTG
jgi:hypothetical protein